MTMDEQLAFLKEIASRLQSAGIPYMMTGSMAMALYSVPRMTRDIDLVIDCELEDAARLAALFEPDCYADRDAIREAILRRSMFNIIHNEWIIKADFIIRKDEPYRRLEFERRRRLDIEGDPIFAVSVEDLILSKLHWARQSGSELQQRDVRTIISSTADLDWPYLEEWASRLDLGDMLDRAREQ